MKKLWVVIILILFFLGVLAAVLFKVMAPPKDELTVPVSDKVLPISSAVVSDPQQFISSCFEKYIEAVLAHDDRYPTQTFLDNNNLCFSQEFGNNWSIISDESGIDPVVLAESMDPVWRTSITVQVRSQEVVANEYVVTLGTGSSANVLIVALTNEGGRPKIDSVGTERGL